MVKILKTPYNWGTYYHFKDKVNYKLLQMGREADFTFMDFSYNKLIQNAIKDGYNQNLKTLEKIKLVFND
jgi:ABC-type branched-subunit amino acid transport system substrate-binding protein